MQYLKNLVNFVWTWIRIAYTKTREFLLLFKELMSPGKSIVNRIVMFVLVAIIIAFVINSFFAFWTTSVQIVADKGHRCESDLSAMKAICDATLEDLDASSDTITSAEALKYLMTRLKTHKPTPDSYVCITDTTGKVLVAERAVGFDSINVQTSPDSLVLTDISGISVSLTMGNIVDIDNKKYMSLSSDVWDGRWKVVVLDNMEKTWGSMFDIFFEVSKRCSISILLAIIGFFAMFILMRHSMLRRNKMEGEIDNAGDIQQQMLPKTFPECEEFDFYGFLRPAKTMGGDLYDYMVRNGKLYFCIGDVSGKGMPAALMMSEVHILFRNVSRHTENPDEIASAINVSLSEGNDSNMFCTMFIGVLDMKTKLLRYCNAGHNPPILLQKADKPVFLDVMPNLAIGLFDEFPYQVQQLQMQPGMSLFVYTDGVSEAEDVLHRLFTDDALIREIDGCEVKTPKETIEHVLALVDHHARMTDQSDDITMICVKV